MDWKIIGHQWAVDVLGEHIRNKAVRHAYLFTGPQGIGRRTLALRFVQALNCTQTRVAGQACGECRACKLIEEMQHPDLLVIQPEELGKQMKIEQVRDIQHTLSLAPYEANYRVAIFLRFDEANQFTMNALLKTLEEPPERVIILLVATNEEQLLPTISSRCEIIRLRPLSIEETCQAIQHSWGVPADLAEQLAHLSGGRPGYAHRLLAEPELQKKRKALLELLLSLLSSSRVERFNYVEKHWDDTANNLALFQTWISLWRDVYILAAGAQVPLYNIDQKAQIQLLAKNCGVAGAQRMVASIARTMSLMERNVNKRLALEVLMLDLPYLNT